VISLGAILGADAAHQAAEAVGRVFDATTLHGTIQENTMNERQITEVSATVDAGLEADDLAHLSEAERLGLIVGAAYGKALAERDEARAQVVALGLRLDQAIHLLRQAEPRLEDSTWASDSSVAGSIQAFLVDVDSEQTPTQED
jgi:hypothetical protein